MEVMTTVWRWSPRPGVTPNRGPRYGADPDSGTEPGRAQAASPGSRKPTWWEIRMAPVRDQAHDRNGEVAEMVGTLCRPLVIVPGASIPIEEDGRHSELMRGPGMTMAAARTRMAG